MFWIVPMESLTDRLRASLMWHFWYQLNCVFHKTVFVHSQDIHTQNKKWYICKFIVQNFDSWLFQFCVLWKLTFCWYSFKGGKIGFEKWDTKYVKLLKCCIKIAVKKWYYFNKYSDIFYPQLTLQNGLILTRFQWYYFCWGGRIQNSSSSLIIISTCT